MKAIILAGGLGMRLRPYTFTIPKPLLPLGNKALIDHLIAQLAKCDVTDLILALGYQAHTVRAYCGDGSRYGVSIQYVEEERPLGTAGCLALAIPLLPASEPFFLVNGDLVTSLNFRAMAAFHSEHDAALTIGFAQQSYQSPFGVLQLQGDNVTGIVEKPTYEYPASAGVYCISRRAVDEVTTTEFVTMPELAMRLRASGQRVIGYRIREFWRALETPEHFEEVSNGRSAFDFLNEDKATNPAKPVTSAATGRS